MANPSRPPHGGRGLKCGSYCVRVSERLSSSTRGTWIEIVCGLLCARQTSCRPPHGGRGLKYVICD